MRSISRALVVSSLAFPLAFAGAGLASAGGIDHESNHCVYYSCNQWWNNSGTLYDQDTSVINAGIING